MAEVALRARDSRGRATPVWSGFAYALLLPALALAADVRNPLETRVKAAFLYKFSGYVEWPATVASRPESLLVFGVMGDDPIADELSRLVEARGPEARRAQVVRIKPFEPVPAVHILFIGRSQADRLGPLIRTARTRPILVVTDAEDALARGSMMNFTVEDGHVRFDVGLASAQASGLTLSSRLLAVAQSVVTRSP